MCNIAIFHWQSSIKIRIRIKDFLNNRHQTVLLEGEHSTPCKVLSGVPRGTALAPLLFLIYINDIPNSITNMLRLYADDALLYSTINSTASKKLWWIPLSEFWQTKSLVNYATCYRADVITFKVGEKNFGEFLPIRQIRQSFLPPSFSSVR